jgi:hypothetical protein
MKKDNLIDEILSIGCIYRTAIPSKKDMEKMDQERLMDTYRTILDNLNRSHKFA